MRPNPFAVPFILASDAHTDAFPPTGRTRVPHRLAHVPTVAPPAVLAAPSLRLPAPYRPRHAHRIPFGEGRDWAVRWVEDVNERLASEGEVWRSPDFTAWAVLEVDRMLRDAPTVEPDVDPEFDPKGWATRELERIVAAADLITVPPDAPTPTVADMSGPVEAEAYETAYGVKLAPKRKPSPRKRVAQKIHVDRPEAEVKAS